ncbi:LOW QUALITY PROTEIN: cytochrome P450 2B4-like [Pomacea canaliculata]|uniref:LOW QUALITY PROTEIN: cytochrome P450 2B4-like n=1 Tax=Pomacea canaliculata TaxID=400727 RepID=UPI000D73B5BF|nr:LOW QUALITY PROTEIN: cytochrome P450 2B4-like [Pomacea canaliculata]
MRDLKSRGMGGSHSGHLYCTLARGLPVDSQPLCEDGFNKFLQKRSILQIVLTDITTTTLLVLLDFCFQWCDGDAGAVTMVVVDSASFRLTPGPGTALPLIGHLHLLSRDPRVQFAAWRRQYGDVFSLYVGNRLIVVLSGYRVIKDALVTHGDVFSDRPHMFLTDVIAKNRGVVGTSGPHWKEQRKVSLEILREMGMGRNVLAEKIQEEVREYVKAIAALQGAAFDPKTLTYTSVSNNICSIVFGERFEYNDPVFCRYLDTINQNFKNLARTTAVNFIPVLKYLPGDLFCLQRTINNVAFVQNEFLFPQLDSHRKRYDDSNDEASDFVEGYLREMNKMKGKDSTLDDPNLVKVMGDLFVAGTETTATVIRWALVYFLHYPEVQELCFQEIKESSVRSERRPSATPELTYVEATIMEVLRHADIAPFALHHGLACDTMFMGYTLPKDTIIIPFIDSVLQDPDIWDNPLDFRPERFIGPYGKLVKKEEFIPFSLGRRVCLGEAMARTELFLYLSTMIQRFRFLPPETGELPSLEGIMSLSKIPGNFLRA